MCGNIRAVQSLIRRPSGSYISNHMVLPVRRTRTSSKSCTSVCSTALQYIEVSSMSRRSTYCPSIWRNNMKLSRRQHVARPCNSTYTRGAAVTALHYGGLTLYVSTVDRSIDTSDVPYIRTYIQYQEYLQTTTDCLHECLSVAVKYTYSSLRNETSIGKEKTIKSGI